MSIFKLKTLNKPQVITKNTFEIMNFQYINLSILQRDQLRLSPHIKLKAGEIKQSISWEIFLHFPTNSQKELKKLWHKYNK